MRAVNLIPAEQRAGRSVGAGESQGGAYAVLGLLLALALMAFLYGKADRHIASSHGEVAKATAEAQRAQAAAARLAPYTSFIATREQRLQAVSTLVDARFDWAHVFHEFGRVLPLGVSIGTLEGTVGTGTTPGAPATSAPASPPASTSSSASSSAAGASGSSAAASSSAASTPATPGASTTAGASPVVSATPTGSIPTFTLSGCATTQREVAVMLERLRLIDGVNEVKLQSSTKSTSSSGSGSAGACPKNAAVFIASMTFDPLPAAAVKPHATTTVAQSTPGAAGAATATTEVSAK
jgi:hypothetical protein